jgi:catalase (peroxidase I)
MIPDMDSQTLHEQDFYAWANQQAGLLRAGRFAEADIAHIADEIESMGQSEKRGLVNRLTVLLTHLLKWQHQPTLRSTSWRLTLEEQRRKLEDHQADNPSLKAVIADTIVAAYRYAILAATRETGMERTVFSVACPWSFEQIMD